MTLLASNPIPNPSGAQLPDTSKVVPTIEAACDESGWCELMTGLGASPQVAMWSYLLVIMFRIALIIGGAMLVRFLLHRAIRRLAQRSSSTAVPTLLRPLKERVTANDTEGQFVPERRRQRAEAIGSVLGSFVTAVVFTMAMLLVLDEFGFELGPLLASVGIVGVALGFGAQSLVKDLIAGMFMLLEDQYGVGDSVDLGEASGVVETVGLRITTVRDARGVLWYIRNGEIVRVGNKSQGWAMVVVDIPIGFVSSEQAVAVLHKAALRLYEEPEHANAFLEPPDVVGVEQLTVDGAVIRTVAKTTADAQPVVQRELRRRLTEALESSGIAGQIAVSRMFPRPAAPVPGAPTIDSRPGGAT